MTTAVLIVVAVVLVGNMPIAVARIVRGQSPRDRLLGVVLTGTTGSALLLVVSVVAGIDALRDTALVVVALATVTVMVWVDRDRRRGAAPDDTLPRSRT